MRKVEVDIINDLYKYSLLKERITTNAKQFFYHHIIFGICEYLLNEKINEKSIIYFNNTQLEPLLLLKYFKEEDLKSLLDQILCKIKKLLPIKVYLSNISFEFLEHLLVKNEGRGVEVINNIRSYLDSVNIERYTFAKVKTFTKRNNLIFLNKEYFNQLKTKQLLIS
jgi:hypothetical protein